MTSILIVLSALAFVLWPIQGLNKLNMVEGQTFRSEPLGLWLEIADEPQEQQRGLSNRDSMPADHGMLFVFPTPSKAVFWMKDMRFNLDFIWLDAHKVIVQIDEDVSPETYPSEVFWTEEPVKYVLEVNAGTAKNLGLEVGERVDLGLTLF